MPDILQPNYMELINRGRSEQSQQANSPNYGTVSPSIQSNNSTSDVTDLTQTDGTSYVTPQVAAAQTQAPDSQPSRSGISHDGQIEFPNINSVDNVGLDGQPTADWDGWVDPAMGFDVEDEEQVSARHQHALQGNDDLFGDGNYLSSLLQPLEEWNSQN